MKHLLLTCIQILVFSQLSFSQTKSDIGRTSTKDEIIGFWKKVDAPGIEKLNVENPWPQKFQWFGIYEDGRICSMMADKDANYTKEELNEVFSVFGKEHTPTYTLKQKFLIVTNPEIKDYQEFWGLNIFTSDYKEVAKKGDLMMTLDDGSGKNVLYYRLLRKVE